MRIRFHPVVLGAFVLGAILLGIAALVFLGRMHVFPRPQHFVVYFHESVSGLEKGAAVKMQGVRVGQVNALNVVWDEQTGQRVVVVVCQVDRQAVSDAQGRRIDITSARLLPGLIEKGLRARMVGEGTTGVRFVGLDFMDRERYPAQQAPAWLAKGAQYPAVPGVEEALER